MLDAAVHCIGKRESKERSYFRLIFIVDGLRWMVLLIQCHPKLKSKCGVWRARSVYNRLITHVNCMTSSINVLLFAEASANSCSELGRIREGRCRPQGREWCTAFTEGLGKARLSRDR